MALSATGLDYRVLSGADFACLSDPRGPFAPVATARMLGMQIVSAAPPKDMGLPVQTLRIPRLGAAPATSGGAADSWSAELWLSDRDCRQGRAGDIDFRCDGRLLYGTLQVHARDLAALGGAGASPLQQASAAAYAQIFSLLEAEGYPHLWRVWNYLAEINDVSDGLERYRQFNVGRHQAFETHGRLNAQAVPAACALGTRDDEVPLSIAFLAARDEARVIENPRQIAAYNYPAEYGPRSPTFARAALARLPELSVLFISGTASIIGHVSMHPGDVEEQTRETVLNIQALLDEASRSAPAWRLRDLSYRAYLRHAEDYPAVQAVLGERLGPDTRVEFVQADICRADLLVEIEAVGMLPHASAGGQAT